MKKMTILFVGIMAFVILTSESCRNKTAQKEQAMTEANQEVLLKVQPPVRIKWSLERENINKRTTLWNAPNKVSFIYLISYGKVMAFYTIKGKVSSVNSQITNPMQRIYGSSSSVTLPSPAEDGSYGSNGDAVFFFTTDGTYVEWNSEYMLADKPLKLSTPPLLIREIK